MKPLVAAGYWQGVNGAAVGPGVPASPGAAPGLRAAVARLLDRGIFHNYADYLIWDVLLPRYLPSGARVAALEIGSAPGGHLVRLHRRFGFDVYGVEYTESGVEANRRAFRAAGVDPAHVLALDFLSDSAAEELRGRFDVVTSFGFVEHFDEPARVITRHVDALKQGGILVVLVPNVRGPMGAMAEWLHPGILAIHNTSIMTRNSYAALFLDPRIERLHCGPVGTLNFGVLNADGRVAHRAVLACANLAQVALNPLLRLCFGRRGRESERWSPYFAFVGRRA